MIFLFLTFDMSKVSRTVSRVFAMELIGDNGEQQ